MTMRATGIKMPTAPRLTTNAMQMGQDTQEQAAGGMRAYGRLEQERAAYNEEMRAANKGGLARLGSAVGGVAGGIFGGPVGAMVGSAAGGIIGGML